MLGACIGFIIGAIFGFSICVAIVASNNGEDGVMKENELIIYGARDTSTGKLVSDITNPRRKYWDRRGNALSAISDHNGRAIRGHARANHGTLELVTFRLVEVKDGREEAD